MRPLWRLVAGADQAVPFLAGKLAKGEPGPSAQTIQQWVKDLDSEAFRVREAATAALAAHIDAAAADLEAAVRTSPSAEVRARAARLLALLDGRPSERERAGRAVRALEYAGTAEAVRALEKLSKGGLDGTAGLSEAAAQTACRFP